MAMSVSDEKYVFEWYDWLSVLINILRCHPAGAFGYTGESQTTTKILPLMGQCKFAIESLYYKDIPSLEYSSKWISMHYRY